MELSPLQVMAGGAAKARWDKLEGIRRPYLDRAMDAASLTIPFLVPPNVVFGSDMTSELRTPYQSLGAQAVTSSSSKILLNILPPGSRFYRYALNKAQLQERAPDANVSKAEETLVEFEKRIQADMDTSGLRSVSFEHYRHLIATGNGAVEIPDEGNARFWPLASYVNERDHSGNLHYLSLRETVGMEQLSDAARQVVLSSTGGLDRNQVTVFTVSKLVARDEWVVHQEIDQGAVVPGSDGVLRGAEFPWIVGRWSRLSGEPYGRGLIEEYIGDLRSLEGLTQAIVLGAAASAHHLWLVNPNGMTRIRDVADRATGSFVPGLPGDVQALRMEKANDFSVAQAARNQIVEGLRLAFFINTSLPVQGRDRVTAEEIRFFAQEIDKASGGAFSLQADEFQLPLVRRFQRRLEDRGELPVLPEGIVEPKIVTGIEGLGRAQELFRLQAAISDARQLLGDQEVLQRLNGQAILRRIFIGNGITPGDLVRSDEEVQADQQNDRAQQLTEKLGPQAISAVQSQLAG